MAVIWDREVSNYYILIHRFLFRNVVYYLFCKITTICSRKLHFLCQLSVVPSLIFNHFSLRYFQKQLSVLIDDNFILVILNWENDTRDDTIINQQRYIIVNPLCILHLNEIFDNFWKTNRQSKWNFASVHQIWIGIFGKNFKISSFMTSLPSNDVIIFW